VEPDSHRVADTCCLRDCGAMVDGAVRASPLAGILDRRVVVLPDFVLHIAPSCEDARSGSNKERRQCGDAASDIGSIANIGSRVQLASRKSTKLESTLPCSR
jgi:hypothetical protein